MKERRKATLVAKDDAGHSYEIEEWVELVDDTHLGDTAPRFKEGYPRYQLRGGGNVNRIREGEFEIVQTRVRLAVVS